MSQSDKIQVHHQDTHPENNRLRPVDTATYVHAGIIDTGWHRHAEHQLLYAEGGVLYVLTDNCQFLLPAFHGAWIPASYAHKLLSPSEQSRLWLLYFQPEENEPDVLQNVRIFGVSPLAREMLRYTERFAKEKEASRLLGSYLETVRLLASEWCEESLSLNLPYTEDDLLGNVTRYILDNIGEPLNIEAVAQLHGLSGRTLMRLFHNRLGMTYGTYLRTARIVKAVELLTAPTASILEVAYDVGYNSPSSFSQAFRRLTGMSPREYAGRNRS